MIYETTKRVTNQKSEIVDKVFIRTYLINSDPYLKLKCFIKNVGYLLGCISIRYTFKAQPFQMIRTCCFY